MPPIEVGVLKERLKILKSAGYQVQEFKEYANYHDYFPVEYNVMLEEYNRIVNEIEQTRERDSLLQKAAFACMLVGHIAALPPENLKTMTNQQLQGIINDCNMRLPYILSALGINLPQQQDNKQYPLITNQSPERDNLIHVATCARSLVGHESVSSPESLKSMTNQQLQDIIDDCGKRVPHIVSTLGLNFPQQSNNTTK